MGPSPPIRTLCALACEQVGGGDPPQQAKGAAAVEGEAATVVQAPRGDVDGALLDPSSARSLAEVEKTPTHMGSGQRHISGDSDGDRRRRAARPPRQRVGDDQLAVRLAGALLHPVHHLARLLELPT